MPIKRIVLTGAECTGKSTLARGLSGYYGEPWTEEFSRSYVEKVRRELTADDVGPIAQGQLEIETKGAAKATRLVFHDTNLLSTILYADHYYGNASERILELFFHQRYDLYLLCSDEDVTWQADPGQRDSAEARSVLQSRFKEALVRLKLPYAEISGNQTERFGEAVKAVDRLLK